MPFFEIPRGTVGVRWERPIPILLVLLVIASSMSVEADDDVVTSKWRSLFDGKTLAGWTITQFGGEGDVYVEDGSLILGFGSPLTGITCDAPDLPRSNYEIQLDAQRVDGSDFFCGLTFPVNEAYLTLVVGGWGGAVVGLSSLDGRDASDNETRLTMPFAKAKWYRIRTQVLDERVRVWIDDKQVIDQSIVGRKLSLRPEVEPSKPLGISCFDTKAALRNIKLRVGDDLTQSRSR